jgi:hypothetical protein
MRPHAVCRLAKCRYAECCGAVFTVDYFIMAVSYGQIWFVKFSHRVHNLKILMPIKMVSS